MRPAPRTRLLAALLPLLLTAACASGPAAREPAAPAVWIDVSLKQPLMPSARAPTEVWFVRIGGLNGSPCLPREAAFPEPAGPDPTCGRDAAGNPVWEPVFLKADRIEGSRAYLDAPPPARYVAVAAVFNQKREEKGTLTLYFPRQLVARTEVAVPAGEARDMGGFRLRYGALGLFDDTQRFVRERIEPKTGTGGGTSAAGLLGGLVAGHGPVNVNKPAYWEQVHKGSDGGQRSGAPW